MDASESMETFGPHAPPHDYVTPYTLTAGKSSRIVLEHITINSTDNRCYLKITSNPNNIYQRTASWHDIWQAAIMVNAMCIRAGKNGVFKVHAVGKSKIIFGLE